MGWIGDKNQIIERNIQSAAHLSLSPELLAAISTYHFNSALSFVTTVLSISRCYITLTMALHLNKGGILKGPAGTGKTETVKDLGKALAYYVIVINCSEGLDYKSMGRMFSGNYLMGAFLKSQYIASM